MQINRNSISTASEYIGTNGARQGLAAYVNKLWGGDASAPLEKTMVAAATSEALSLAWLSGVPQRTFPGLLESKIKEAKQYVRRQQQIRSRSEQIVATSF